MIIIIIIWWVFYCEGFIFSNISEFELRSLSFKGVPYECQYCKKVILQIHFIYEISNDNILHSFFFSIVFSLYLNHSPPHHVFLPNTFFKRSCLEWFNFTKTRICERLNCENISKHAHINHFLWKLAFLVCCTNNQTW